MEQPLNINVGRILKSALPKSAVPVTRALSVVREETSFEIPTQSKKNSFKVDSHSRRPLPQTHEGDKVEVEEIESDDE